MAPSRLAGPQDLLGGAQQLASVKCVADPWLAEARQRLKTDEADRTHRDGGETWRSTGIRPE